MNIVLAIVLAAIAPGGIIVVLIERTRRENNRDHERNSGLLKTIDSKVDELAHAVERVDDRLDGHIEWHIDHK